MAQSSLLSADAFQLVTKDLQQPAVFKKMIDLWPCKNWSFKKWVEKLGNKKMKFRIGPRQNLGDPLWENQCFYLYATMKDFHDWLSFGTNVPADNPLQGVHPDEMWCYADYKYMVDLFGSSEEEMMLKIVDWSVFGFEGRNGKESTLWMGSEGSHTPCHYDTYGFNLVAQLQGRKRWILFPPEQTEILYPTRIPYEESSVFSKVNITSPNLCTHSSFQQSTPYVVTLNPGDVLFVPHNWWHFVESLEPTITINTWIEMDCDDIRRVEEALTRILVTTLANEFSLKDWLNPTEELSTNDTNFQYLKAALRNYAKDTSKSTVTEINEQNIATKIVSCSDFNTDEDSFQYRAEPTHSYSDEPDVKKQRLSAKNLGSSISFISKHKQNQERCTFVSDKLLSISNELLELIKPISFDEFLQQIGIRRRLCNQATVIQSEKATCFVCQKNCTFDSGEIYKKRNDIPRPFSEALGVIWDDTVRSQDSSPDCIDDAVNIRSNMTVADKGISKEECEECQAPEKTISINEQWDPECSEIADEKLRNLLINCVAHPQTVSVISNLLRQNINNIFSKNK